MIMGDEVMNTNISRRKFLGFLSRSAAAVFLSCFIPVNYGWGKTSRAGKDVFIKIKDLAKKDLYKENSLAG